MAFTVEQAIHECHSWRRRSSLCSTPLSGGITNLNYRIDADGKSYVLRITGEDTDKLGIRRDVEYAANLAAEGWESRPRCMYYIEPEGYLVTRFIKAKRIPPGSHEAAATTSRRAVRKLRLFHRRGPEAAGGVQRLPQCRDADRRGQRERLPIPVRLRLDHAQEKQRLEEALLKAPLRTSALPQRPAEPELAGRGCARGTGRGAAAGLGVRRDGRYLLRPGQLLLITTASAMTRCGCCCRSTLARSRLATLPG